MVSIRGRTTAACEAATAAATCGVAAAAIAFALAACGAEPRPAGPAQRADEALVGLWGADLDFGPALAGPLAVRETAAGWEATIGGVTARLTAADGARRDATGAGGATGEGALRGAIGPDGAAVRLWRAGDRLVGHWIQPPGVVHNQAQATPIALVRGADGVFRGEVVPLRDAAHQYLVIERGPAGLTAWIRETEKNVGRYLGDLSVEVGPDGAFAFRNGEGVMFTAHLVDRDHLAITLQDVPGPLIHTRRTRADAPGFFGGPPGPWVYRAPVAGPDAWPVATLAEVGLDAAAIAGVVGELRAAAPTSWRSPAVHALVVARHGKLVLDEYFAGHDSERLHDLRSAGKTLTTTLLGAAIDRGLLAIGDRAIDRVPALAGDDPRRAAITLAHLASMSSGLACDDDDRDSPGNEDRMQGQRAEPDWVRYIAALPLVRAPGERAVYCTGALNLLGAALVGATGQWLPDLFAAWLAAPLDIARYHANLMPTGEGYGGGGLRLRPRDLAKLPQLVLGGGTWNGRRVVSAAWLADATAAHASLHAPGDYGYGWWRRTLRVGDRDVEVVYASGNGGQLAVAAPALDLVVVITGGNYGYYPVWAIFLDELVPAVLAAAR